MKDRTITREIPVAKNGRMASVKAIFYPRRRSISFFDVLKNFLKETEGAHDCPHDLYLEAANWWLDTGKDFTSINHDSKQFDSILKEWKEYLETKALL